MKRRHFLRAAFASAHPMGPIIEAAAGAGVAHCHVEQDHSPDPMASIGESLRHLGTL